MDVESLKKIMKKCDVYFEDRLISGELLLRSFMEFLTGEAGKAENNGSIVLHLASPCFDAISVAWVALAVIAGNETDVESIIRNLRPGDKVLYDRKRAEFIGLNTDEDGVERVSIRYGGGTARIGRKSWARITPYYGQSERYDGRGIRRGNRVREEFLATLLECDKKDIPSVTDASVIIVMDRQRANRCMDGLVLQAGNLKIRLQDLVTASYFTEGNEYPYGGNAGKNEAMIKFASKISVGLDMTWESDGNEYLGMFVCGNGLIERGITELGQVMTRESIGFSVVSGGMDLSCAEELIKEYGEAGVFACTKDFLLEHTLPSVNGNDLTVELQRQADAMMDREIHKVILHGETDWKAYRDFKKAVGYVRMDELDEDERAYIIPNAYSLMNLFMTAPFSVREMEDAVKEEKIRREVGQPHVRLEELEEKLKALPANLTQAAEKIADSLETAYYAGYDDSPKRRFLKEYIQENHGHWIAVVVPKAYYADIIWNYVLPELDPETSGIEIVTMARFDGTHAYDRILVVGNLIGKHFDIFRCMSSAEITVLLYEAEAVMFHAREKRSRVTERLFNERQCTADDGNDEIEENVSVTDVDEIENVDEKITSYTEEIVTKKFDAALRQEGENNTVPPVDVSVLVRFEDGEGAMLSKHYEAYVLNDEKGEAEKKKADDLKTGDRMIFLNRDEDTRDIVDYILQELIDGGRIADGTVKDYEISRRWKNDLLEHMKKTGHSPRQLADEMKGNGVRVQKNTVMNWIDEDAHIVAPQSVESLEQIALLTNDTDMFDHAAEYFEACRRIRRVRKDILRELGTAIIKFLEGQEAPDGIIPLEIRERLGTLAAVLRIETIIKDNRSVPAYMTNRPLDLDGGL